MKLTNHGNLPQPLVDAIANDEYSRGNSDISATQLIDSPRKVELSRRHETEIEEDASDRIFSLFGQAVHTILERANRTGDVENRLYMKVNGWSLSGQFDRIALVQDESGRRVLQDWKTASVNEIMYGVKPERELQLNVLAELARENGYTIDKLEAVFILRDWSKIRASRGGGYPQLGVAVVELPLWTRLRAQVYIGARIDRHKAVREGDLPLPECSPEERWQDPDKWAVMKTGQKRAVKLADWEAEAVAIINNTSDPAKHYIEKRTGTSKRCRFFCSVGAAGFCSQWNAIKAFEDKTEASTDG